MKAVLRIELYGEDTRTLMKSWSSFINQASPGLGDATIGSLPPSGWVAEITGYDDRYKYARSFLERKLDYSHSNSKGSRGIFAEYILESEHYYEVKRQISWGKSDRYFCVVDYDGNIIKIPEDLLKENLKAIESVR
jgi:hypothetical protein